MGSLDAEPETDTQDSKRDGERPKSPPSGGPRRSSVVHALNAPLEHNQLTGGAVCTVRWHFGRSIK